MANEGEAQAQDDVKEEPENVQEARKLLAPFLAANPDARVDVLDANEGGVAAILTPWGDRSLAFTLPEDLAQFADHLNPLVLPNRLSAIWHSDKSELEVIWTAYKLPPFQTEISKRKFSFQYEGCTYECEFGVASDRLLALGKQTIPLGVSPTTYRNLHSFARYSNADGLGDDFPIDVDEPRSFWIRGLVWQEDKVFEVLRHINFYLTYYDRRSPTVVIHSLESQSQKIKPQVRYVAGSFPENVRGRVLDDVLLNFWDAAREGDQARRFLYYYRIIEYASFFYLDQTARLAVRKILAAPNIADDVGAVTEKVVAAIGESKLDEYARYAAVIRDTVDAHVVWGEIEANLEAFTTPTEFDGGFVLAPLAGANCREEDFLPRGLETVAKAVRDIRNALSHGRDQKTGMVITPTVKNLNLLQPWVYLIAAVAGEVVLYKDVS